MAVLVLLLLVALGVVLLAVQRSRRLRSHRQRRLALRERTLFDLQLGDIVQADGRDWVVEDRLIYEEDGFQWLEYLLRDGEDARWLVVNEDDWLEVSWQEAVPFAPPFTPMVPLPPQLEWQGEPYTLREQGRATVSAQLRRLNQRPGSCRYADYVAAGGRVLSVELWGEGDDQEAEVTAGYRVEPASLTLLPGDGRSVYRSGGL